VDSVSVRPCRIVWMRSFLFLLRICLISYVLVLSNCFLSDVRNRCQPLRSLLFCLINIGQSYVLNVSAYSVHQSIGFCVLVKKTHV
jgi:hypothetical protein